MRELFLISFSVAAIGPGGLRLFHNEILAGFAFVAIPVWIGLFILGISRYGKQALWLLVIVPLLCYVPFLFWEWSRACTQTINACP